MSLLKLLFELPDAGGQCNFTMEEQEDLIAFEQNLDQEDFVANFELPETHTQLAFLQDGGSGTRQVNEVQNLDLHAANVGEIQKGFVKGWDNDDVGSLQHNEQLQSVANEIPNGFGKDGGGGKNVVAAAAVAALHQDNQQKVKNLKLPIESEAHIAGLKNNNKDQVGVLGHQMKQVDSSSLYNRDESSSRCGTTAEPSWVHSDELEKTICGGTANDESTVPLDSKKQFANLKHAETGHPLWIKWRGKWQTAIQCHIEDCRMATVKAKPTYGKKKYIVVYMVRTRMYLWVDEQNVCPLTENPSPLVSGYHLEWREMVAADTGAPRRRLFLSLGWDMLDISDRLHILGVIERARCVDVWKGFVKEATEAFLYSDLGGLLVRIQAVIEPLYVRRSWVDGRLTSWTHECLTAISAATIEKLTKELIKAILWDSAASLWEIPVPPELEVEWTDWKGDAFDELTKTDSGVAAAALPVDSSSAKQPPLTSSNPKIEQGSSNLSWSRMTQMPEGNGKVVQQQKQQQQQDRTPQKELKLDKLSDMIPSSTATVKEQLISLSVPEAASVPPWSSTTPSVPELRAKTNSILKGTPGGTTFTTTLPPKSSLNSSAAHPPSSAAHPPSSAPHPPSSAPHPLSSVAHPSSAAHPPSSAAHLPSSASHPPSSVHHPLPSSAAAHAPPPSSAGVHAPSCKRKADSWGCSAYLKSRKRRCRQEAQVGIYCQKHQGLAVNPVSPDPNVVPSYLCMARLDRVENRRCAKPMMKGSLFCDLHILSPPENPGLKKVAAAGGTSSSSSIAAAAPLPGPGCKAAAGSTSFPSAVPPLTGPGLKNSGPTSSSSCSAAAPLTGPGLKAAGLTSSSSAVAPLTDPGLKAPGLTSSSSAVAPLTGSCLQAAGLTSSSSAVAPLTGPGLQAAGLTSSSSAVAPLTGPGLKAPGLTSSSTVASLTGPELKAAGTSPFLAAPLSGPGLKGAGTSSSSSALVIPDPKDEKKDGGDTKEGGVISIPKPGVLNIQCIGKTASGSQCTHVVKDGSVYCMQHGIQETERVRVEKPLLVVAATTTSDRGGGGGRVVGLNNSNTTGEQQPQQQGQQQQQQTSSSSAEPRCMGRTLRFEECLRRAKSGSKYCEKHVRGSSLSSSSAAGACGGGGVVGENNVRFFGDGTSSILMNEATLGINLQKDRRNLLRAQDLLCRYLAGGVENDGYDANHHCKLVDSIVEEAIKDARAAEVLLKILSLEKERLHELVLVKEEQVPTVKEEKKFFFWGDSRGNTTSSTMMTTTSDCVAQTIATPSTHRLEEEQTSAVGAKECRLPAPPATLVPTATPPSTQVSFLQGIDKEVDTTTLGFGVTCGLCADRFEQLSLLGRHWMERHKWEAYRFQKCLSCRVCGDILADRMQLLSHGKSAHPSDPISALGWSICVVCDKQFMNFDHLWQHVEDQHSLHWRNAEFAAQIVSLRPLAGHQKVMMAKKDKVMRDFDTKGVLMNNLRNEINGKKDAAAHVKLSEMMAPCTSNEFICTYCGKIFHKSDELGRHQRAVHKDLVESKLLSNSLGPQNIRKQDAAVQPNNNNGKLKWRHRARAKAKNISRTNVVPMKNQSSGGGAKAILQRMKAMKQVLDDHHSTNPIKGVLTRKQHAEVMRKNLASNQPNGAALKYQCRFCGLRFPLLPDLGRHHQEKHLTVKQAFITNGLGEPQTGMYMLSKDGVLMPSKPNNKLLSSPDSKEILDVARFACCKTWLYNELGKRYVDLPPRLGVQAAHLCSVAKVEIRWHIDGYVCPEGCKEYSELREAVKVPSFEVDLIGLSLHFPAVLDETNADQEMNADIQAPTLVNSTDQETGLVKSNENMMMSMVNDAPKSLVLLEDLSNGQEQVPIVCVVDQDTIEPCTCSLCIENAKSGPPNMDALRPWDTFVYGTKRLLDPSLGLDTKDSRLGCSCGTEGCAPDSCDHVSMFDNDNTEAQDIHGQSMRGRFPYDNFGRIIVEEGYMVYECNSSCRCREDCENRILQKGVRVKLEVFKSRHKGWGVRAGEPIARGTFVCEYVGEVLNDQEANKRGERYDQVGCSYLYDIDAHLDITGARVASKPFVIDATKYGNVARFINHSCAPNLINYEVLVESMDCQLAHIGFFANRDIVVGEELAYNYRYKLLRGKGCPCHCGAPNCRGRLY